MHRKESCETCCNIYFLESKFSAPFCSLKSGAFVQGNILKPSCSLLDYCARLCHFAYIVVCQGDYTRSLLG